MVLKTRIWVLWPGKFTRTSCFGSVWKMAQMGTDGYRLMQMGANGRMVNGRIKNKAKGVINGQKQGIF